MDLTPNLRIYLRSVFEDSLAAMGTRHRDVTERAVDELLSKAKPHELSRSIPLAF